jgi:inward rectifier potassium channel
MPVRTRRSIRTGLSYGFSIIDDQPTDWRDAYHWLLQLSWPSLIGILLLLFMGINALFAALFFVSGGITSGEAGASPLECFFFSVQTFGTIGYGALHPVSVLGNALVVLESFVSLVGTALVTGLVFVRFSHVRGKVRFSKQACITVFDDSPHLVVRLGNLRSNRIYDATFRLTLVRTVRTKEGTVLYRNEDLTLIRDQAPNLLSAFSVMHRIDRNSPLWGCTPQSLVANDTELQLAVSGTDETTLQPVHGRHTWEAPAILIGSKLTDVVHEEPNGDVVIDLRTFDAIESIPPITWA